MYFDNAVASPLAKEVLIHQQKALEAHFSAPLSPHQMGQNQARSWNHVLSSIRQKLGIDPEDTLLFAPSRAVAVNHVIQGVHFDMTRGYGKDHFLTSELEEAATLFALERLGQLGAKFELLKPDDNGIIQDSVFVEGVTPRTALASFTYVHPILGVIQPLEAIQKVCGERGILLHVDITQALGKMPLVIEDLGADFVTFSSQAFHGPRNATLLWIRKGVKISSLILGSEPDAMGAIDLVALTGLDMALDKAGEGMMEVNRFRALFEEKVEGMVHFQGGARAPHISTLSFPGVTSEALLFALNQRGVFASMGGGACQEIGHLLQACHKPPLEAKSALSFAFSRFHQEEEILQAATLVNEEAKRLKVVSESLL